MERRSGAERVTPRKKKQKKRTRPTLDAVEYLAPCGVQSTAHCEIPRSRCHAAVEQASVIPGTPSPKIHGKWTHPRKSQQRNSTMSNSASPCQDRNSTIKQKTGGGATQTNHAHPHSHLRKSISQSFANVKASSFSRNNDAL
eukprot:INCI2733.1.p1 GENE.INCI2733.1~~INCI2733.1.p1  ORF type:complete len:142 (+),score=13.11 INCI2733.1:585-1010(+)